MKDAVGGWPLPTLRVERQQVAPREPDHVTSEDHVTTCKARPEFLSLIHPRAHAP